MSGDRLRRLKQLEKENERLRRAVSDPTPDTQILIGERMHANGSNACANVRETSSLFGALGSMLLSMLLLPAQLPRGSLFSRRSA